MGPECEVLSGPAERIRSSKINIAELKLLASCALRYNAAGVEIRGAGSF